MTQSLQSFLKTGIKPASDRERSALLDEARSFCATIAAEARANNWIPPETPAAVDAIKLRADAAKIQRQKAQAELDARIAAQREKLKKQAAKPITAKPSPASSRFAAASDAFVIQAATHRSSPAADKIEARAELEKRGFTITADGIVSKSLRKS